MPPSTTNDLEKILKVIDVDKIVEGEQSGLSPREAIERKQALLEDDHQD